MFRKLSDTLGAKFKRKDELGRQLEIARVFDIYKKEHQTLFPNDQKSRPVVLKNQILTIKTSSSVLANELRLREGEMVEKINNQIGGGAVKKIIYKF